MRTHGHAAKVSSASAAARVSAPVDLILSPQPGAEVRANNITLYGRLPDGATHVRCGPLAGVVSADRSYFIHNVILALGKNTIRVHATDDQHKLLAESEIELISVKTDAAPLQLKLSNRSLAFGAELKIELSSPFDIVETLIDFEGRGQLISMGGPSPYRHRYQQEGVYHPWAVIKTKKNLYHSSMGGADRSVFVGLQPHTQQRLELSQPIDLHVGEDGESWVLTARDIVHCDTQLTILRHIALPGGVEVSGFCRDQHGHFLIVDQLTRSIVRLLPNGQPDTSWAQGGSTSLSDMPDGLQTPTDVVVDYRGNVFVLDQAASRIVMANSNGRFLRARPLQSPSPRLAILGNRLFLTEQGDRGTILSDRLNHKYEVPFASSALRSLTPSTSRSQLVCVSGQGVISIHDNTGVMWRQFKPQDFEVQFAIAAPDPCGVAVVAIADKGVRRILFPTMSPDSSPEAVWTQFLAAFSSGDYETTAQYVTESRQQRLGELMAQMSGDDRTSFAKSAGYLRPKEIRENYAFYSYGLVGDQSRSGTVRFFLNESTDGWLISAF